MDRKDLVEIVGEDLVCQVETAKGQGHLKIEGLDFLVRLSGDPKIVALARAAQLGVKVMEACK